MFPTISRLRRSAITLVALSAILLCWTNGASAFHLAKLAKRDRTKVVYVEREPVVHHHHHYDGKKHGKKHWKHHHRHGLGHQHHHD